MKNKFNLVLVFLLLQVLLIIAVYYIFSQGSKVSETFAGIVVPPGRGAGLGSGVKYYCDKGIPQSYHNGAPQPPGVSPSDWGTLRSFPAYTAADCLKLAAPATPTLGGNTKHYCENGFARSVCVSCVIPTPLVPAPIPPDVTNSIRVGTQTTGAYTNAECLQRMNPPSTRPRLGGK
jgi:hypothetical protein